MDALADIMAFLRTSTHLYGRLDLKGPYGIQLPGGKGICIIVLKGSCLLGVDSEPEMHIRAGDFVLLPAPKVYSFRSAPKLPLRSAESIVSAEEFQRVRVLSYDGGAGPLTTVLAGCFTWDSPESQLLIQHLPRMVYLAGTGSNGSPRLRSIIKMIQTEASNDGPGASAIIDRLAEVLFIQAMRSQMDPAFGAKTPHWLRAFTHPQIGEALRQMHTDLAREWTVTDLARTASMSRSSFAEQFRQLVGETPLDHLTKWRMAHAANLMRATQPARLATIAAAVGYESESSFGKAFRRIMGMSPGDYRSMRRANGVSER